MNQNTQKSWMAVITRPSNNKGTSRQILNETSQRLLNNLIRQWISELQLPIQPWSNVLLAVVLSSVTHVDISSHPSHHEARIWIDCVPKGTPEQSQFLPNVYQGEPQSNVLPLPHRHGHVGGTIKLQGLVSSTGINDLVCVLMHVAGNMQLEIDMLRDHHLTQQTQPQKKLPALPPPSQSKSLIKWVFRNTKKRKPIIVPSLPNVSATTLNKEPLAHNLSSQLSTALISSSAGRRYPLPEVLQHFQDEEKKQRLDRKPQSIRLPSILSRSSSRKRKNNRSIRYAPALLDQLLLIPPSSLLGFIHQQHLAFTYSCSPRSTTKPCVGPNIARMDYYRYNADPNLHITRQFLDQSLGRTIMHVSQLSKKSCREWIRHSRRNDPSKKQRYEQIDEEDEEEDNDGGCDTLMIDHVFYFAHSMSRIRVDFRDSPNLSDSILMWSSCDQCEMTTSPRIMSDATFNYSFAKYLEFMIYDRTSKSSCSHALPSISHWFYFDRCVLRLSREAHPPKYTLCTPNLHHAIVPPIEGNALGREIDEFFTSIIRHLDLIGHYLKGEARHNHQLETQQKELKVLQRAAHGDYSDWMLYYSADENSNANDVRRAFVAQASSMLEQLTEWQRDQCPELIAECAWDPPDYFGSDKGVHAMPESFILVREDEPTSIIAYTLNCSDYIAEIQGEDMKPTLIDNGSVLSAATSEPTTTTQLDRDDFYFTSLERYYLEDEASSGIIPPPQPFATARQMLVQRVRQQENHITKLRTHWRSKFHHSNLPTRWRRYHGQAPTAPLDNVPISWDTQQERTLVQNNNDAIKEIKLSAAVATVVKRTDPKSPHIRHKFVHGNTEFTCIVYYAQEFDELRKRCGVNQLVVESLCRCQPWTATGGKSKSRFYKTKDDRLVIKEMISSWNLAEKQQFLEFAPAYFDYMRRTYEAPSVLTKIFGFYTIRMTDNHRRIRWAMDVMVMDHLFYNRNITQRFDFKGIRDRQAESQHGRVMTTLWDSDWIHDYRLALPTTYHSKALLIDIALRSDTEFIEKCNIMDYSLLVGIDEMNKEIVVGIVDFIGAYTWYKKIESKSKSTLKPQKQVTVLPPQQYRARFCREISNYFCSVPGKFDRVEPKEERNSFVASFCGFHMSS